MKASDFYGPLLFIIVMVAIALGRGLVAYVLAKFRMKTIIGYVDTGRYNDAIDLLRKEIDRENDTKLKAYCHCLIGICLEMMELPELAAREMQEAAKLNGDEGLRRDINAFRRFVKRGEPKGT